MLTTIAVVVMVTGLVAYLHWDSLDRLKAITFAVGLVTAIGAVGLFFLNERVQVLQAKADAEVKREADLRRSENERKTAEANAEAKKALEAAAVANAGQAKANESAEAAKLEAAKANERAATLEKDAADARLELERIKERTKPREVTPDQKSSLKQSLETAPKGRVSIGPWMGTGAESKSYAEQIKIAIEEAGYQVDPKLSTESPAILASEGVFLYVADINAPPAHAQPLASAMLSLGLLTAPMCSSRAKSRDGDTDKVRIYVGKKPSK